MCYDVFQILPCMCVCVCDNNNNHNNNKKKAITITSATYGGNCVGGGTDHTSSLAVACNDNPICDYYIDSGELGDPVSPGGCTKTYSYTYTCSDLGFVPLTHTVTPGTDIHLFCGKYIYIYIPVYILPALHVT